MVVLFAYLTHIISIGSVLLWQYKINSFSRIIYDMLAKLKRAVRRFDAAETSADKATNRL